MVLFYGLIISGLSDRFASSDGAYLWLGLTLLLGTISFSGSVFFLSEIRKDSDQWYWGMPFLITLLTIILTSFSLLFYVTPPSIDPVEPVGFIHIISLILLAPVSIPFFFSFQECSDTRYLSGVLAGFISIFAFVDLYFIIKDVFLEPVTSSNALTAGFIFFLIGASMVGFCFVLIAIKFHRNNGTPTSDQNEKGSVN